MNLEKILGGRSNASNIYAERKRSVCQHSESSEFCNVMPENKIYIYNYTINILEKYADKIHMWETIKMHRLQDAHVRTHILGTIFMLR